MRLSVNDILTVLRTRMEKGFPAPYNENLPGEPLGYDGTLNRGLLDELALNCTRLDRPHRSEKSQNQNISIGKNDENPLSFKSPIYPSFPPGTDKDDDIRTGTYLGHMMQDIPVYSCENNTTSQITQLLGSYDHSEILVFGPHRENVTLENIMKADAIELDLSIPIGDIPSLQYQGGPKEFYPSTPNNPELRSGKDIKDLVAMIRELGHVPVICTIDSQCIDKDMDYLLISEIDAVKVRCGRHPLDGFLFSPYGRSMDPVTSLIRLNDHLKTFSAREKGIKVIIDGPILTGNDIILLKCLGADMVVLDTTVELALGLLIKGETVGMGDQVKWDVIGEYLNNLFSSLNLEYGLLCNDLGLNVEGMFKEEMVTALTYEAAARTGLKLDGYGDRLSMWKH